MAAAAVASSFPAAGLNLQRGLAPSATAGCCVELAPAIDQIHPTRSSFDHEEIATTAVDVDLGASCVDSNKSTVVLLMSHRVMSQGTPRAASLAELTDERSFLWLRRAPVPLGTVGNTPKKS